MNQPIVVGDIGGTNARFAMVLDGGVQPELIEVLPCADYNNMPDALADYLALVGNPDVKQACLSFACPIHQDRIKMTNNHWDFSQSAVQQQFGFDSFKVINDFTALALSVPYLTNDELMQIGGGEAVANKTKLVIGPGTGLGMAGLASTSSGWLALSGEGGHVDFAPRNRFEMDVLEFFLKKYPRVSVERLLCGAGLVDLYEAHCQLNKVPVKQQSAADISSIALSDENSIEHQVLAHFCNLLGAAAGNAALILGAEGGVYIMGGIIPRFKDFFAASQFRQSFENKGRLQSYAEKIPTYLVLSEYPGLVGAAAALNNSYIS
ncbi:glucokinase [Spartinivicinus poritis]|uniref:Glucokinase n=1 Tax=Spartinivicinus poritis TaxID=2994640 RepID=A0ABT5U4S7_9GAMM|nr:glucokinase [Spartinivicinus sp. A2-2]MDE1461360.1 glucokinase [Spartinivicinus sp. A2-2]